MLISIKFGGFEDNTHHYSVDFASSSSPELEVFSCAKVNLENAYVQQNNVCHNSTGINEGRNSEFFPRRTCTVVRRGGMPPPL